jgi:hypothetical protein
MDSLTTAVAPERPAVSDAAASLDVLIERVDGIARTLDRLEPLLALAEQAPAVAAIAGDSADELMRTMAESGIDVEKGVIQGAGAALRFGASMDADKVSSIEALLKSGVLDPAALRTVGQLARALAESAAAELPRMGPFALLGALQRPDVQRALGFLVVFAERFGRGLPETKPVAR